MATASFSEARKNLTQIADRVVNEGVEYTIFKRSKPLFKIVPVTEEVPETQPWTRREAARRAEERAAESRNSAPASIEKEVSHSREARDSHDGSRAIPSGGEELFEYAMRLRSRSSLKGTLTTMTPEDLKRELADRDA